MLSNQKPRPTPSQGSRDYVDIAARYCEGVLSAPDTPGHIDACKWVKDACKRQQNDLARQSSDAFGFVFDHVKASRVCKFIECLPHIKGPLAGALIVLAPWQAFILTTCFGWVSKYTDKRRFRRVYTEVPRGNGKSCLSSGVALYMAFADNEGGAEVYSAARTREQARFVFDVAQAMARKSEPLCKRFGIKVKVNSLVNDETMSSLKPLASEADSLDGANAHFACLDELHAHRTREVYDSLETSTGKRDQSLLWSITTAGTNRAGICYEVRTYATKVLSGTSVDESFFGIIYTLDPEDDWALESSWKKANPNYGISVFADDIAQKALKAVAMASAQPNFKTKHLNVWVNADHAWMDMRKLEKCADETLNEDDLKKEFCFLGLDLATKQDLCASIKLFTKQVDGKRHYYAFGHYWLPEESAEQAANSQYKGWAEEGWITLVPDAAVNLDDVETYVKEQHGTYRVKEVAYDAWNAKQMEQHFTASGIVAVSIPQTVQTYNGAMKEFEDVVAMGRFHFDGDPVFMWAVSNVVCHRDAKDNIYPRKQRPENKIDPVTALLMAMSRAMVHAPKPFVYATRGITIL